MKKILFYNISGAIQSNNISEILILFEYFGNMYPCHRRLRKGVLRNFAKFTGKHLCQSLFFNEVAGLIPATLLKKRLWHRCFPVNFVKFLRTPLGDCFCLSVCKLKFSLSSIVMPSMSTDETS